MADGDGNGTERASEHVDQLVLTLQRYPWQLQVGGHVENDNVAMAMLQEAVRAYETRLRLANAAVVARQVEQARQDEEIRRQLAGRH